MPSTNLDIEAVPHPVGPQAVLWDMDGTLIDTEPYWIAAEMQLVTNHGGTWSDEQAHDLVGVALPHGAKILQEAGVKLSIRQIIDHLSSEVTRQLKNAVPWRPGALELLTEIHAAGLPQALVTMSERSVADHLISVVPAGTFTVSVTGEEVSQGKPNPEPYLLGLARLSEKFERNFDAAHCIAVEDSKPGITSASTAGLHAVLVPNATDPGQGNWRRCDSLEGVSLQTMTEWLVQVHA